MVFVRMYPYGCMCLTEKETKTVFFPVQSLENSFCAERESVGALRAELKGLNKAQGWW